MTPDTRSLTQLLAESHAVQDACNLSGVVYAWSRSMRRLCEILRENGTYTGTDQINSHPINVLWASKVASLTRCEEPEVFSQAYMQTADVLAGMQQLNQPQEPADATPR